MESFNIMLIYKLFYDIIEVEAWEVRTTNVYFMAHISGTLRRAIVRGVRGRKKVGMAKIAVRFARHFTAPPYK